MYYIYREREREKEREKNLHYTQANVWKVCVCYIFPSFFCMYKSKQL